MYSNVEEFQHKSIRNFPPFDGFHKSIESGEISKNWMSGYKNPGCTSLKRNILVFQVSGIIFICHPAPQDYFGMK